VIVLYLSRQQVKSVRYLLALKKNRAKIKLVFSIFLKRTENQTCELNWNTENIIKITKTDSNIKLLKMIEHLINKTVILACVLKIE
jgi:hypothetical protein